jgi:hypothetical protein
MSRLGGHHGTALLGIGRKVQSAGKEESAPAPSDTGLGALWEAHNCYEHTRARIGCYAVSSLHVL